MCCFTVVSIFQSTCIYFCICSGSYILFISDRFFSGNHRTENRRWNPEHSITGNSVFHLCGNLYELFRVTKRIMNFCNVVTKRMTGGLGQVNVLLSTLMGGLSEVTSLMQQWKQKSLFQKWKKKGTPKNFLLY